MGREKVIGSISTGQVSGCKTDLSDFCEGYTDEQAKQRARARSFSLTKATCI